MKKVISLLLAVMMVLSLSACGGNETATGNDTGNSTTQNQTDVTDTSSTEQNTDTPSSTTNNSGGSDSTDIPSSTTSTPTTTTKPETSKPTTTTKPGTSTPSTTTKPSASTHTHSYSGATCTAPAKCSCGAIQGEPTGHVFDGENDENCNKCNFKRTINCTHKNLKIVSGCAATCENDGLTDGKICNNCGIFVVKQNSIAAKGHKVVTDKAVDATCTKNGLTEGKHCSNCNMVIVKQETVAKLAHNYSEKYISENPAHILFTCEKCGDNYKENIAPITAKISTGIGTMLVNGVRYDTCIYIEDITGGYGTKKIVSSAGYKSFTTDFDFENGQLVSKTVDVIYLQSGALSSRTVNITISDSYGNTKTYQVQI